MKGHFLDNAKIILNERVIRGDSIFFDDNMKYASAAVFQFLTKMKSFKFWVNLQSYSRIAIVTKYPVAINTSEIDSLFISADTLYSVGDNQRS